MTDDSAVFGTLTYLPRQPFYRGIKPLADPYATSALEARDKEMTAAYGPVICRRPFPGEFTADYAPYLDDATYVVVDFLNGRWRRQLGEDERPVIRPRRRGRAVKR